MLGLVPKPAQLVARTGRHVITRATVVHAAPVFAAVARRFARDVADPFGFEPAVSTRSATSAAGIHLRLQSSLPAEGYRLEVSPSQVIIHASAPAGAFYALETVKQLLPPAVYRRAPVPGTVWAIPAVSIEDAPRFSWRGAHLDGARHFMPKEFVRKYIDLLARHKLNRFHWHLTDDQGWRLEVKKYPRLTEVASCREATVVGSHNTDPAKRVFDGRRHCGFYTQDDVREIVAYAAERMITVVPEVEMPGHVQAAITAYPFLSSRPDTTPGVMQVFGVSDFILAPSDSAVAFMQDVLREVLTLFPSPWIHIGGDEADKKQWKASPAIQARIKSLGLKDEHEMQSWFVRQMDTFLSAQGRRMIGWDEILEGGLAEQATVMSWRGTSGGIAAAKAGHDVVMARPATPTSTTGNHGMPGSRCPLVGSHHSIRRTRSSPFLRSSALRKRNMCSVHKANCGVSTSPTPNTPSIWRSRGSRRCRRWSGAGRNAGTSTTSCAACHRIWHGSMRWT